MKMMKRAGATILFLCLLSVATGKVPPGSTLFFSISIIEDAFDGPIEKKTGHFFYKNTDDVFCLVYEEGKNTDTVGIGGREFLDKFALIGFESFDFRKVLEEKNLEYLYATDGAKYEISVRSESGMFVMKEWNPSYTIEEYSDRDEHIARLKKVIDLFAYHFGMAKLRL